MWWADGTQIWVVESIFGKNTSKGGHNFLPMHPFVFHTIATSQTSHITASHRTPRICTTRGAAYKVRSCCCTGMSAYATYFLRWGAISIGVSTCDQIARVLRVVVFLGNPCLLLVIKKYHAQPNGSFRLVLDVRLRCGLLLVPLLWRYIHSGRVL